MNDTRRTNQRAIAFFSAISALMGIPQTALADIPIERQVEEVVSHLVGAMDTSAQAIAAADAPNVRITTCKISIVSTDTTNVSLQSVFLYQEQALSNRLRQPYRQRFLQIAPSADGETVESKAFRPPDPQRLVGLCDRPQEQRMIQKNAIGEAVCSVFLQPQGETYIGETPPEGCPTNYKGAVRITNRIILHSAGMDTSDRGFDAAGNQVWGSTGESYQFRWINLQKVLSFELKTAS